MLKDAQESLDEVTNSENLVTGDIKDSEAQVEEWLDEVRESGVVEELKDSPVFQEIQSSRLTGILDGSLLDLLSFDWLSATKPKSGEVPQLRVSKMIAIDFHAEADVAYVVSSSIDGKSWSYVCEVLRRVSGDVGLTFPFHTSRLYRIHVK